MPIYEHTRDRAATLARMEEILSQHPELAQRLSRQIAKYPRGLDQYLAHLITGNYSTTGDTHDPGWFDAFLRDQHQRAAEARDREEQQRKRQGKPLAEVARLLDGCRPREVIPSLTPTGQRALRGCVTAMHAWLAEYDEVRPSKRKARGA